MEQFEEQIHSDLQQYLLGVNEIDERLPECPDVEGKWEAIANAYIPDGVREFQNYPLASLGWMMYIGMALAKMWDDDWQYYEANGAVFLPAAGFRDGTGVYNVGSNGFYWSSTPGDEYDAYYLYFDSEYLDPQYDYRRNYGRSVRLVKDL